MKPKTTLNLLKHYFSDIFQKIIQFSSVFFTKKTSLVTFKLVCIFIFMLFTVNSYSQSCKANLAVDHDLNVGSCSPKGTYYLMVITNTGSSTNTYSLSATNINSTCSNTDGSSTASNINLETSFVDTNLNPINQISVGPGQSVNFYSHVTIPSGTNTKKWCCSQVFAESQDCTNYKVSTVLHTFYSGPSED